MAAWSGLGVRDCRHVFGTIASELDEVRVLDRRAWAPVGLRPTGSAPALRLLPAFDGLLLAHRDRSLTVAPEHACSVLPGGGVLRPTVLEGGQVRGTWRLAKGRPEVEPFGKLSPGAAAALRAEAEDVVRHRAS